MLLKRKLDQAKRAVQKETVKMKEFKKSLG